MDKQLFSDTSEYLSIKDASLWASKYLKRKITSSNISYLIQYGKLNRYGMRNRGVVRLKELQDYYADLAEKNKPAKDVDWALSFSEYRESETTKHVHRLHPYKGKFIPQLVEYFIGIEENNRKVFKPYDILLDPFCGSGTALIQANESCLNAVGLDVSSFNTMISNAKLSKYNVADIIDIGNNVSKALAFFQKNNKNLEFEEELSEVLAKHNSLYFAGADYKVKVRNKEINEKEYVTEKENNLLQDYYELVKKHDIKLLQDNQDTFLGKWFLEPIMQEINFVNKEINKIDSPSLKTIFQIILSRTVRSCRATTHADLGTLKEPVTAPYYCRKHYKLCRPIFSINNWWQRYLMDTANRIGQFEKLRSDTQQICLHGDSRSADIAKLLKNKNKPLSNLLRERGIRGIISSPPYVGLIDYHEQHAYAYELFEFMRLDDSEIGPLSRGQGIKPREDYTKAVAEVLRNCARFMCKDYDVFLVANDKHNLYPKIAELANMKIFKTYKRPVLNRVEKDRNKAYHEQIFHLKRSS